MTREPVEGKNNWLIAGQDKDWRGVVWGKGRVDYKGMKYESVENTLDQFVANRERTGYVVQAELKINVPARKIRKFVVKYLPSVAEWSKRFVS